MGLLALHDNYLDQATRSASSANSDFPAANLYDGVQRSLTWRSAGYFEVTASNKTIVFEETSSTPLTATIAEANYTSDATFFAAVKAALEAAGASTYTVSRNTTSKKITIASDGGGGGGIFNLLWTNASTTAEDLLGFDNAGDDTGALTYTADNIRIHTSEWLKWDLGASSNPDAFMLVGKSSTGVNLSAGATIKLQGNLTDDWSSPAYDQTLTYDEAAIVKLKTTGADGLHSSALRHWRVYMVDKDNANGYVELAAAFLGAYYTPTTGKAVFPFSQATVDNSDVAQTLKGAYYGTAGERTQTFSVAWANLTTTEKEQFDTILKNKGRINPFFVVMDPDTYFSSDVYYFSKYVRFGGEVSSTLERPGVWSASWQLVEEI